MSVPPTSLQQVHGLKQSHISASLHQSLFFFHFLYLLSIDTAVCYCYLTFLNVKIFTCKAIFYLFYIELFICMVPNPNVSGTLYRWHLHLHVSRISQIEAVSPDAVLKFFWFMSLLINLSLDVTCACFIVLSHVSCRNHGLRNTEVLLSVCDSSANGFGLHLSLHVGNSVSYRITAAGVCHQDACVWQKQKFISRRLEDTDTSAVCTLICKHRARLSSAAGGGYVISDLNLPV